MPVKIKVEVILCPHQRYLGARLEDTWPLPARLPVQITKTGGGAAAPVSLGETNDNGVTRLSRELERGTYRVEIPGYDFETDTELDLTGANDRDTLSVRLAPRAGRWLVALRFTENPAGTPLPGATMNITSQGGSPPAPPSSAADGLVYATAQAARSPWPLTPSRQPGAATLSPLTPTFLTRCKSPPPSRSSPSFTGPSSRYRSCPRSPRPAGAQALTDASVTVEYRGGPGVPGSSSTKTLSLGASAVLFGFTFPGVYVVTVIPPADFGGLPITAAPRVTTYALSYGRSVEVQAPFDVVATQSAGFRVKTPRDQPLKGNVLLLQVLGPGSTVQPVAGQGTKFTADVPAKESLTVQLDPAATPMITVPRIGDVPLTMSVPAQPVETPPGETTIALEYLHSITAKVIDEHGSEVAGAMIDVFDDTQTLVITEHTDKQGGFILPLPNGGTYYLAQHPQGGEVGLQERVDVHSNGNALVQVQRGSRGGPDSGQAVTDLSAYPMLTEEISTTGVPAPAGGGAFGGGAGTGYGQAVDQVIRDVLGWRPGGDLSGFQAALSGAFQLREVEGHTEWTWQQRGYAVQADMGALTGAQASIYARAKAALDQIQPLLAGLTSLNPAKYEPQDLESIRTVVRAELQELVTELALEGGPRIQRVDELFKLLLGKGAHAHGMNPDLVQGQLGTLRDRFALTVDEIQTVDEERIVTNFRIIVEQVLALYASWIFDKSLLSAMSPRASFGTVLIWLSRGLEAVCESVGDLMFALDSVFVDAAQRQVIELRFAELVALNVPQVPFRGNPPQTKPASLQAHSPMFLSDLLDWVLRTSRDEGPRIIQDAGKDGVLAFTPVLETLRILVRATRQIAQGRSARNVMPAGMRTPRVDRALQVLADQLG